MEWVRSDAAVKCDHDGRVENRPSQRWLAVGGVPVLVEDDPVGRAISGCPNVGPTIKPCATTLRVATGYSDWIRVAGRRVVLSTLTGLTDGTPPGTVRYTVLDPGQRYTGADR
jgi:hypothetical protein